MKARITIALRILPAMVFLTGCSTVTPYSADLAAQSALHGRLTAAEAAALIHSRIRIGGEYADAGNFALDEEGFSFKKTTESAGTEHKDDKPVTMFYTEWTTRDVPWDAVSRVSSYFRDYRYLFTDQYQVQVTFRVTELSDGRRSSADEEIEFSCRSHADLVDVLAALKTLME